MKIKFKRDYVGRETAMLFFRKDEIIEPDHQVAIELISFGLAEEVKEASEEKPAPVKRKKEQVKNED